MIIIVGVIIFIWTQAEWKAQYEALDDDDDDDEKQCSNLGYLLKLRSICNGCIGVTAFPEDSFL